MKFCHWHPLHDVTNTMSMVTGRGVTLKSFVYQAGYVFEWGLTKDCVITQEFSVSHTLAPAIRIMIWSLGALQRDDHDASCYALGRN